MITFFLKHNGGILTGKWYKGWWVAVKSTMVVKVVGYFIIKYYKTHLHFSILGHYSRLTVPLVESWKIFNCMAEPRYQKPVPSLTKLLQKD